MTVLVQDSFQPLTPADVEEFESELGFSLPAEYRDFLIAHNGGSFADPVVYVSDKRDVVIEAIEEFYGLKTPLRGSDLRGVIRTFQGPLRARDGSRMPVEVIPVGETAGSNICLGIGLHSWNRVFWWYEEGGESPWECTLEIADSFEEFLGGLEIDEEGRTISETLPLFQAVESGDEATVRSFLAAGHDPDCRNESGMPLLLFASVNKRVGIVGLLLSSGAEVDSRDRDGRTSLHLTRSTDVVQILLDHGANPNVTDTRGRTPLMYGAQWNDAYKVLLLLNRGARVDMVSCDGADAIALCQPTFEATRAMIIDAGRQVL
jgi:hypothetical protein